MNKKSIFLVAVMLTFFFLPTFAEVNGSQITSQLKSVSDLVVTIMYIIVGIFALIGSVVVGQKYWNNDENAGKALQKWVSGLAVAGLAVYIIQAFIPESF